MIFKRLSTVFLLTLLFLTVSAAEKKSGFIARELQPMIDSGEVSGAIGILIQGNRQEIACVGWANVEKQIPISADQLFMQCSQTKAFCGVTVAMLVEEGKISLDDPVAKYLPEFSDLKIAVKDENGETVLVPAKNTLTIRMIMNHTGGFPFEIPSKKEKGWSSLSLQDTAKEAARQPLLFEPGTKMTYSNTGIDIGAAIVEKVTGKPWDLFLQERVLTPLEMNDSTFFPTDEKLAGSICLYEVTDGEKAKYKEFNPWMPLPHNGPDVYPSAGAGLWTTANDQVKFYKMLMNLGIGDNGVRILKEETVRNILAANSRPDGLGEYSLGLAVHSSGTMGHGGAWGTGCTVNWKKKELQLFVVQINGSFSIHKAWARAASKFFAAKMNTSGTDEYTGRLE